MRSGGDLPAYGFTDRRKSAALPPLPCRSSTAGLGFLGEYPWGTSATKHSSAPSILTLPSCSPAFHFGSAAAGSSPARDGGVTSAAATERARTMPVERRIATC